MFTRTVSIDGTLYREHGVYAIEHVLKSATAGNTYALVRSTSGSESRNTRHELPMEVGMTFAQAEAAVMELPFFAEVEDPYAEVVADLEEQVEQQSAIIDEVSGMLDDNEAATVPQAYREWQPDTEYVFGDRRRYADKLYKCIQPHTSQADYTPDVAVSLWALIIASDDPSKPLPWVQPDSTNAYSIGNRVTHNGKVWESDCNNNVWEPGVYGWHVVEGA